ncbi:putative LRR receptor-like serine/threonine-protein kinase [Raphanus sativus]|uniref:non-specific serine/threonine protein kinase n=1 Tax=Raphanus sativus TaxID=3726 RepID=A0A9W3DCX5_RAPSA|nr:probable LRR receptor-like serine/threonine-protein kinase At1g06840 [Raphanus sativus]XP_056861662.1 probable LRR receptor-like serine/threonine-protein kinase At1g06840 [Raphanus sativus]KAJ4915226.1 putative LRR receptor-like serine/threonine-protein kinase [Raphanus sativus]
MCWSHVSRLLPLFLLLCFWSSAFAQDGITNPVEVKALRAIKESLSDPVQRLRNWRRGDPCNSNWTGVLCWNSTLDDGYLHVRELQLLRMNLSGTLSPDLGRLTRLTILDFMWNNITGSIPKEIGNIKSLELLLLNGNRLSGNLPEELGYLPNLDRIQIDENRITGPLPKSFGNLTKTKHFHMNNNSISGQIPPELGSLPSIVHILLDNNNLSGFLPPELANMPNLLILQLDNNHFDGATIPPSYGNMSKLLKLSLRNCSLQGPIPDLSTIPDLGYLDLSRNQLNGSIPTGKLSDNITTIDLSNNSFTGTIPTNFSGLPRLQKLSVANNALSGSIPSSIYQDRVLNSTETLIVDLRNNRFSNITGRSDPRPNVTVWLQGNPLCSNGNLLQLCGSLTEQDINQGPTSPNTTCSICPPPYELSPEPLRECFCAAPLLVGYRLKSPGFSDFIPYVSEFQEYLTSGLSLDQHQLLIDSFQWQKGPRLRMYLKFFPLYGSNDNNSFIFNRSEVRRIRAMFTGWNIRDEDLFGPYELMDFTLSDVYRDVFPQGSPSGVSKGAIVGIVLGSVAAAVTITAIIALIIMRKRMKGYAAISRRKRSSKASLKIEGVKSFTYAELSLATENFSSSTQIGQGGYGKVYKGILGDGTAVAIKRAQEGSLQGEKEFLTEIELLSRLHHRNLVALVGFCDEEGEQMLVYEYMEHGTLRDNISVKLEKPLDFAMRMRIAIGSAKGILYLHTEANPPIFHRDIKASNILLDSRFIAKVADFGLSRLAPVPDMEGISPHHVSTVVKGTPGYLDPEYFLTHQLTDKSDVYSLGVVFLELLTGMHPITHGKNIVRETNIAYQSGSISSVVDKRMSSVPAECIERFATLALRCCREETDSRPSMAEVVRELEIIWELMPESKTAKREDMSETMSQPSSSSNSSFLKNPNPYTSMDVSGSDLVSGVVPSVAPR